ncbi:MAG: M14 family zinc carboxypeptidase [bacterium]|nr:M14 family zinc carboxypeptidase [bacterium]
MKKTIFALVFIAVGIGTFFLTKSLFNAGDAENNQSAATTTPNNGSIVGANDAKETAIGKSVEGRDIVAYHYGTGDKELLFVGGIHGGYEWNTVLVAYELMDYVTENPGAIPANVKITIIPVLNPDGLNKTLGTTTRFAQADVPASEARQVAGRFNANTVDLNRNFDCDWQATGMWQTKQVSGGSAAFSEPESAAIKNYVETNKPRAVVTWYSSAGGVFASSCHNGVLPETNTLTKKYADASGYPSYQSFNFYEITGDMVNWLAKENIPAISVLLTNHTDTEWTKNRKGIEALLAYYAK